MNLLIVKRYLALPMTIMLTLVMLLPAVRSAMARDNTVAPSRNGPIAPSQAQGPTDPAELEAFLDDFFARTMEEYHVAGAAIAVVKDGTVFFSKGYGYADLENDIPVDPDQTIFRIGSVGKVFTWTAVMQLVEQGKLDLDADINTYLDFRIPNTYPQPITLKHLMTHTSGFEDRWLETVVADAGEVVPAPTGWSRIRRGGCVHPVKLRGTRTTMPCWRGTSWRGYRASPTTSTSRSISLTHWA